MRTIFSFVTFLGEQIGINLSLVASFVRVKESTLIKERENSFEILLYYM